MPAAPASENKTTDDFLIVGKKYIFIYNSTTIVTGKVLSKPTDGWVKVEGNAVLYANNVILVNLSLVMSIVQSDEKP